jgi:hypothetical protein
VVGEAGEEGDEEGDEEEEEAEEEEEEAGGSEDEASEAEESTRSNSSLRLVANTEGSSVFKLTEAPALIRASSGWWPQSPFSAAAPCQPPVSKLEVGQHSKWTLRRTATCRKAGSLTRW